MDALAELIVKEERGEKVSEIEECILYYFDESDDSYEKRARIAAAELARLRAVEAAADFHPRATKLMLKKKNFIVIAEDEPYFSKAYAMIRVCEMAKGTWTEEDERLYRDALVAALQKGE
jgi:hypothetical protein